MFRGRRKLDQGYIRDRRKMTFGAGLDLDGGAIPGTMLLLMTVVVAVVMPRFSPSPQWRRPGVLFETSPSQIFDNVNNVMKILFIHIIVVIVVVVTEMMTMTMSVFVPTTFRVVQRKG